MRKPTSLAVKVRKYLLKHPKATTQQIIDATGAGKQYIWNLRSQAKRKKKVVLTATQVAVANKLGITAKQLAEQTLKLKKRGRPRKAAGIVQEHYGVDIDKNVPKTDNVNHPAHYKVGGIETIDFIEAKGLGYNLGNVVKYIARSEHKGNREEDLLKARWYLNREIAKLEKTKS